MSPIEQNVEKEVLHGEYLASHNPEKIWGWETPAGRQRATRRAQMIIDGARLSSGMRILEVGCGTGLFTEMFAQANVFILAVDISNELLEYAAKRRLPPGRVQFLNKKFEECAVEGPFDAVIGSSILHHLDIEASLGKMYSLLKTGGRISFAEPNMLNPQIFLQKNIKWIGKRLGESPDETAFVRWKLARILERKGFRNIFIRNFDWLHPYVPGGLISPVQSFGKLLEKTPIVREFSGSIIITGQR